jgi:predicted TPR repeat methyltransferase
MHDSPDIAADSTTDIVRQAMQEHGHGRFEAAEALYQRVLEQEPRHPDGLHLLGVLMAQRGRHRRAAELIGQAIQVRPGESMFHNNLGNVCVDLNELDQAEASYLRALECDPARLDALNNLGVLLSHRGQAEGAEKLLGRVIELAPGFADARQNLANHYLRQGWVADAVQQCVDGLIVEPRNGALRRLLGAAYAAMGKQAEAAAVYRAWLAAEPDNVTAAYYLKACTGEDVPDRAPDAYVSQVFDSFAGSFDAKLAALDYRAPQLCAAVVADLLGPPAKSLHVLDAGCGTGLCAPLLAPYAARLAGVDLSEGMLKKAVERRLYDELVCGELVAYLQARRASFDLIVAADTLCYFGLLGPFAQAAAVSLRAAGQLVFTVEAHADDDDASDFRLHGHGRYSHRRRYVESALAGAGLVVDGMQAVILRTEAQQPVDGWVVSACAA